MTASGQTARLDRPREPPPAAPEVEIARSLFPPDYLRGEEKRRGVSDASGPAALPNPGPLSSLAAALYVGTPSNLTVTGVSASQISMSWTAAAGATNHRVERANSLAGPYALAGTTAGASFSDGGVTNGAAHLYRVCSADSGGNCVSPYSNLALGTAVTFSDDPLGANTTVKARQFDELRQAVNAVRAAARSEARRPGTLTRVRPAGSARSPASRPRTGRGVSR